jgi:hypothetical protein
MRKGDVGTGGKQLGGADWLATEGARWVAVLVEIRGKMVSPWDRMGLESCSDLELSTVGSGSSCYQPGLMDMEEL